MPDRKLMAAASQGVAVAQTTDGATPVVTLAVDPENINTVTTLAGADFVLVSVGGVIKKISFTNLAAVLGFEV